MARPPRIIPTLTLEDCERFWSGCRRNTHTGCLEWIRATNGAGYGVFRPSASRNWFLVHRIAFVLQHGEPPCDHPLVCHTCDNPRCAEWTHLWAGTVRENAQDASAKGLLIGNRSFSPVARARGERHGIAKLTDMEVLSIFTRFNFGESASMIARSLTLSPNTVTSVLNRNTWTHIQAPRLRPFDRAAIGEAHPRAQVTAAQVSNVRALYDAGTINGKTAMSRFGLSKSATYAILRRGTWKHVP